MKRQRGRGRKPNGHSNRPLESNVSGQKTRGTATQIHERYQQLARDAASAGDIVAHENFLQHAEHYFRIMRAAQLVQRERAENEPRDNESNQQGDDRSGHQPGGGSGPLEVVTPEAGDITPREAGPDSSGDDGKRSEDAAPRRPRRVRRPTAANGASGADDAREALDKAADDGDGPRDPAPSA